MSKKHSKAGLSVYEEGYWRKELRLSLGDVSLSEMADFVVLVTGLLGIETGRVSVQMPGSRLKMAEELKSRGFGACDDLCLRTRNYFPYDDDSDDERLMRECTDPHIRGLYNRPPFPIAS